MQAATGRRIVIHVPTLRGGGAERVSVLVANGFAARGHEVTLFVWDATGPNTGFVSPQVNIVDLGLHPRGENFGKFATIKAFFRSIGVYRNLRADAVFSALEFANLLTALALTAGGSKAAFFPSFHAAASLKADSLGSRLAPLFSRIVAWRATAAIAVSRGVAADLATRGFRSEKVTVIGNPIPPLQTQTTENARWREQLEAMGTGPVIVTLGRLVEVKDHRTLIEAFAKLDPDRECRLAIFGDGPLHDALERHAVALGVRDKILFGGYSDDPAACYAMADVFVLSSLSEGFGNVLVEAMSAGVPVVSTDAPHGPREILADGRYGLLVPVGDAAALAAAIEKTLDQPQAGPALQARAVDFSEQAIGDRYEALLPRL
jgi:glycosyltransferase involved in cell wall biosynthesis